jgi:Rod binding protein
MSVLDIAYGNGMNVGGLGTMNRSSQQRKVEREEAQELAGSAARSSADSGKVEDAKLRGVAEEFVSVFMNEVMKSMRATVQENPEMHGDNGEKFFQQMLDQEYSTTLSKGSGYGLTDLVYQSLASKARVQSAEDANSTAGSGAEAQEIPGVASVGM